MPGPKEAPIAAALFLAACIVASFVLSVFTAGGCAP
jgi:hypothetical protein